MKSVKVKVYGTDEKQTDQTSDYIGVAHAQHGFPVEITVTRGNNRFTTHLSFAEATELSYALAAVRAGEAS